MLHVDGDCVIPICADFQDPVEMIPQFVHEWENGYKIVCAIKSSSKENKLMYWARSCYYKMIKKCHRLSRLSILQALPFMTEILSMCLKS